VELLPSLENATVMMTMTVTATMNVTMTMNEDLMDVMGVMGVMSLSATMCEHLSNAKQTGEMMPNVMKKSENPTSGCQLSASAYRDALTHSNSWCSHHSLL
jgi:hypothetical protein